MPSGHSWYCRQNLTINTIFPHPHCCTKINPRNNELFLNSKKIPRKVFLPRRDVTVHVHAHSLAHSSSRDYPGSQKVKSTFFTLASCCITFLPQRDKSSLQGALQSAGGSVLTATLATTFSPPLIAAAPVWPPACLPGFIERRRMDVLGPVHCINQTCYLLPG